MSPPKGHTTLSDLLADDVRDYFLREGVSDSQTPTPTQTRSASYSSRKKRPQNSNNLSKSAAAFMPLSSPTTSSSSGGSLRSGWANTPPSSSSSKSSTPTNGKLGNNSIKTKSLGGNNQEKQSYQSMQHQQQSTRFNEEQIRGQNTAEYHSMDNNNTNSLSNNRPNNLQQEHRRHSSGSGSFHSHHSRGSRGSASSRSQHVSAADAAFLRRYAEEKERTNMRMAAARPNWKSNETTEARVPFDPIADASDKRPYHSIIQSPRPPTVTGSHRPGLPSIDNDDWEEDDRIERRDKRKMERKEARKLERHRRMDSATPSTGSALDSVVVSHNNTNRDRANSTGGDSGAPSMGTHGSHKSPEQPYNDFTRMASQGSIMSSGSVGFTPGTNESMSYSAESSQNFNAAGLPPEPPYSNDHNRRDSMGSFIRKDSSGSNILGIDDGRARQGSYPLQETILSENDKPRPTRHVRPLSYLSASSDSDGKGGEQREGSYPTIKEESGLRRSPPSSSSGTYGHLQIPDYTRFSSTDGSDLNSALLGSAILGSSAASQESTLFAKVNQPGRASDYRRQRFEDDESSGSYDSDSDESSYTTSDSYDGDSSSQSHSSSEQQHRRRARPPQHTGYQNYNNNRVRWEPVNFDRNRDLEAPFNERDRLRNGAPNYSSIETKTRQKQNRYRPSPGKPRLGGPNSVPLRLDDAIDVLSGKFNKVFVMLELYVSNMPSLVGSLALAWGSLGVDWFKWYEETFDACHPTHYHNKACVFKEFPGCFACETDKDGYQFFLHFHYLCSTIAFILSSVLVGKILIAFPVVRDELANPTTAAPLGLLCMAFEKVFAGNFGHVGEGITFVAVGLHTTVAAWFIFISIVYKTLPEPSWFSNTTGIGLAAAKLYLYWTPGGYFLSIFSLLAFSMFYLVSLYRIHANEKISAPVCWVQLSAPAVVLYGFTIFSQPGSEADDYALLIQENKEHFYQIHRTYYMPVLHVMFGFCMISMASSLFLLRTKWKSFREKEFSPAHVSFCAPLVSHANAMQAYRSSVQKFSTSPPGTAFKLLLYRYWTVSLICGTVLVIVMSTKFFAYLPSWCQIDVEDDEMPPEPEETIVTRLLQRGNAGDELNQNYVSAAVLQANESGALVRVLQDGRMKYVRSRRMPSMGFDPIMNVSELMSERDRLLQHVTYAANPTRDRGGMNSFDDVLMTFNEPDPSSVSDRRRLKFLSFDASTMMRG